MKYQALIDGQKLEFSVHIGVDGFEVTINDIVKTIDCIRLSPFSYSLIINGKSHYLSLNKKNGGYRVTLDQQSTCVQLKDETQVLLEKFGFNETQHGSAQDIISPIPGLVKQVFVKAGDAVEKNTKLLILEAMKMENEILSTKSGIVDEVVVEQGMTMNKGELLLRIAGGKV